MINSGYLVKFNGIVLQVNETEKAVSKLQSEVKPGVQRMIRVVLPVVKSSSDHQNGISSIYRINLGWSV